ncbi:MAG: putative amidophosphoribosyltransferase [Verrucomicrobia bacterium]|nr:MAG: putative amidophosphoribosyltransferase [Verrucomicrobiota bacterium]
MNKVNATLGQLARGLGDVVFPPGCVLCRGLVDAGADNGTADGGTTDSGTTDNETTDNRAGGFRHVCGRCVKQIDFVSPPHCSACGHPFYGEMAGERMCPHCEGLAPAYREGRTAVLLKGPARALVHELKYHRGLFVLSDMEEIFRRSPHVLELARGAVLVPVPLHPRKERERAYNQSLLLAGALARAAGGGAQVESWLRRTADTVSQTHHDRKARQANLKNAFALVRGAQLNPDLHIILVDDVFTTGSTLNSCALVLRRAGCLNLDVITFGHG